MLDITIPGYRQLQLHHLVLDFNGTLAFDGVLCVGVRGRLDDLGKQLQIHCRAGYRRSVRPVA
jgi:hypothetical protein